MSREEGEGGKGGWARRSEGGKEGRGREAGRGRGERVGGRDGGREEEGGRKREDVDVLWSMSLFLGHVM